VWWVENWTQPDEFYMIVLNHTDPYPDLEFPINWWDWIEYAPKLHFTITHNLGILTETSYIRARAKWFMPIEWTPVPVTRLISEYWSHWTDLIEVEVTEPIPVVEIATVIGIGGIAIAIANNYWSGRREKKMTDVTRTAAEDERFMNLYDASRETTFQENMAEVLYQYKWTDYEDFVSKYGPETNVRAWAKIQSLAQYFEGIGVFVDEGSIDISRVSRLFGNQVISVWEKLKNVITGQREREMNPSIYSSFERLYYAIKTFQQQGPQPKDDVKPHKFED
jgi:hypothetical protein